MLPDLVSSRFWRMHRLKMKRSMQKREKAAARSREWFKNNQGTSLEDVVVGLRFSMDQIRSGKETGLKQVRFFGGGRGRNSSHPAAHLHKPF